MLLPEIVKKPEQTMRKAFYLQLECHGYSPDKQFQFMIVYISSAITVYEASLLLLTEAELFKFSPLLRGHVSLQHQTLREMLR